MSNSNTNIQVHYTNNSDEYRTPDWLYNLLNREFNFTLDPASDGVNNKCAKFYTKATNGLGQSWAGETVFVNPPYSDLASWIKKSHDEALAGATVVMLIPARTDTKAYHKYIATEGRELYFIEGRLKFSATSNSAPFPSMLVLFSPPRPSLLKLDVDRERRIDMMLDKNKKRLAKAKLKQNEPIKQVAA